jgi:outer membrane lipoprotein-sorting protein
MPPPEVSAPQIRSAQDAFDLLRQSYGGVNSLKASGKIQMRFPGEKHRRQASIAIMMQCPDKLRMRAYRPLSPTLFEFVSDGDQCWFYLPSRQSAYLSEGCKPFRIDGGKTTISAELLFAAILVSVDPETLLSQPESLVSGDGFVGIVLDETTGGQRELWIDPETGLAVRQVLVDPDGSVRAEVKYLDHARESGTALPIRAEAVMEQAAAEVALWISHFEINAAIPDDAFIFLPPEGSKILPTGNGTP